MYHIYNVMDTSFLELRCKEVINIVDGKKLGHIVDIIFNLESSCVLGIVVPGEKNFWNVFKGGNELFIPMHQIIKIGQDCLLVEIFGNPKNQTFILSDKKEK